MDYISWNDDPHKEDLTNEDVWIKANPAYPIRIAGVKMSKYERAKLWAKRNQDKIIFSGVGTLLVGLVIVSVKSNIAYQDRVTTELNNHIGQLNDAYSQQSVDYLDLLESIPDSRFLKEAS